MIGIPEIQVTELVAFPDQASHRRASRTNERGPHYLTVPATAGRDVGPGMSSGQAGSWRVCAVPTLGTVSA